MRDEICLRCGVRCSKYIWQTHTAGVVCTDCYYSGKGFRPEISIEVKARSKFNSELKDTFLIEGFSSAEEATEWWNKFYQPGKHNSDIVLDEQMPVLVYHVKGDPIHVTSARIFLDLV